MSATSPDVKSIFGRALEIESPAERSAFLSEACAADPALRAEVEDLLRADRRRGFHERPALTGSDHDRPCPDPRRPGHEDRPVQAACSRSARAAWASSTWPSRSSPSAARWR